MRNVNIVFCLFQNVIFNLNNYPIKKLNIKIKHNTLLKILNYLKFSKVNYIWYNSLFIYYFFKKIIFSLFCALVFLLYFIYYTQINFLKQLIIWYLILNTVFWLFSGFNYFLKKYRFGKFTTAIQRFWKRTNIYFWLVEGFLFILYFYYYLNSSQEPNYFYDHSSVNQDYVLNLQTSYISLFLLFFVLLLMSYLLLSIQFLTIWQQSFYFTIITFILLNIFFIETYQFYYLLNSFYEITWAYSDDNSLWSLFFSNPKFRAKYYYYFSCLIAKYWHFMFIFISWLFFIVKIYENNRVRINFLGLNYQNLLILSVLNLLCYVQWIKFIFRRFFDIVYFWFFTTPDFKTNYLYFNEIQLLVNSFFNF